MNKKDSKVFVTLVFDSMKIMAFILIVSMMILVSESSTKPMVVTVTVNPTRVIIVDRDLVIRRIISNTKDDVRPVVYLESEDGRELPYTESITEQYLALKSSMNFKEPGIIYDREDRVPIALVKYIIRYIRMLIGIST